MQQNRLTSDLGRLAEDFTVKLLEKKGYKIVDRNFESKFGEIDIIATVGDVLVFVEVKARWSQTYGAPEEAVTPQKLYKIRRTAEYYCLLNALKDQKMRIDVVALEIREGKVASSKIISVD